MPGNYPVDIEVAGVLEVPRWRPLVNWLLSSRISCGSGSSPSPSSAGDHQLVRHLDHRTAARGMGRLHGGGAAVPVADPRLPVRLDRGVPQLLAAHGLPRPGDFPAVLVSAPASARDRLTVLFRIFMVIPQYIVLDFVGIAAGVLLLIAWFAVLFTGRWPEGMRQFCIGYYRWSIRLQAYFFLITDVYPPFSLEA